MDSVLVEFYKHNAWANRCLLDVCAGLSDAQLDAGAAGTFGPLGDTLVHLVTAQERYVAFFTSEHQEPWVRESKDFPLLKTLAAARHEPGHEPQGHERQGFPGFERLRESAEWSGQALIAVVETMDPGTILRGRWRGEPYILPVFVPLLQAINHATEHRTHIATILTQQGVEPPSLDGWTYGDIIPGQPEQIPAGEPLSLDGDSATG